MHTAPGGEATVEQKILISPDRSQSECHTETALEFVREIIKSVITVFCVRFLGKVKKIILFLQFYRNKTAFAKCGE